MYKLSLIDPTNKYELQAQDLLLHNLKGPFFLSQSFPLLPTFSQWVSRVFVIFYLITLKHTPQSVGLLWTRDRPVAEASTW
jgi:hypothetical protein